MAIVIKDKKDISQETIIELYESVHWSSAKKPDKLYQALLHSHALLTAWDGDRLVGLGNAISDGYLVVYYAHLVVHPDVQGQGVGRLIVDEFKRRYGRFHQQVLVADGGSITFYEKCGFERAGQTQPMWIYQGDEH